MEKGANRAPRNGRRLLSVKSPVLNTWPPERPRRGRHRLSGMPIFGISNNALGRSVLGTRAHRAALREGQADRRLTVLGTESQAPKSRYEGRSRCQLRFDFPKIRHAPYPSIPAEVASFA
jgi:hypothetical protein